MVNSVVWEDSGGVGSSGVCSSMDDGQNGVEGEDVHTQVWPSYLVQGRKIV